MSGNDFLSAFFLLVGLIFFLAGTVGLLRFPDVYTRLHALTKADNLGLGCICLGLALQVDTVQAVAKLLLIWLLVMFGSATVAHLIARTAREKGYLPWQRRD